MRRQATRNCWTSLFVLECLQGVEVSGSPRGESAGESAGEEGDHDHPAERGHGNGEGEAPGGECGGSERGERDADDDSDHGTDEGGDLALDPDHSLELAACHAHRAQGADLPGPLDDREYERVDDPEQADDDRERKQHVEQIEHKRDRCLLALDVRGDRLDLGVGEPGEKFGERPLRRWTSAAAVSTATPTSLGWAKLRSNSVVLITTGPSSPLTAGSCWMPRMVRSSFVPDWVSNRSVAPMERWWSLANCLLMIAPDWSSTARSLVPEPAVHLKL